MCGKGRLQIAYPTEVEYNRVMGGLSTVTGGMAIILMLVGSNLLRSFELENVRVNYTCSINHRYFSIFRCDLLQQQSCLPDGMKIVDAI